jgi:hypothetical protein
MQIKELFSERTDNLQAITGWVIYFFINILFCIKYNPYEEIKPVYLIVFYPLVTFGIYKATAYLRIQQKNFFFLLLTFAMIFLSVFLWIYIDRWSVDVDRWSALAFWSENLKNGNYPYGTLTHMGTYASPLPVWQLFHFPFYLLGDTAYGQLFCLLIFFVFLFCCRTRINIGGIILLLALSPGFWWEIAVRSDLLCNMLLLFVFLTAQFYYPAYWKKHKILTAFIIGLFLCTKLLVAIPLFLYFFPYFLKMGNKEKGWFALSVIGGFSLPLLPFLIGENSILNHPEYNPFLQQTRQGSTGFVVAESVLIVSLALIWRRMRDLYFLAGLFLFVLVLTVAVRVGWNNGWCSVLFEDEFDKSYFNVCIPFFLFFIHETKEKRFDYSNYHIRY